MMGEQPVRVEIVSNAATSDAFARVNWEDPHFNIGLPIFSIHGNHDDPVREGDQVCGATCARNPTTTALKALHLGVG
ncbi:hypothetical protein EON67_11540, partial [archaeon]